MYLGPCVNKREIETITVIRRDNGRLGISNMLEPSPDNRRLGKEKKHELTFSLFNESLDSPRQAH